MSTLVVGRFTLFRGTLETTHQPLDLLDRKFGTQAFARRNPVMLNRRHELRHGRRRVSVVPAEFRDRQRQDIELPHRTQMLRDSLQTTAELLDDVTLEAQGRKNLAQSSRRHASLVYCLNVAVINTSRCPAEGVHSLAKRAGRSMYSRHKEVTIVTHA